MGVPRSVVPSPGAGHQAGAGASRSTYLSTVIKCSALWHRNAWTAGPFKSRHLRSLGESVVFWSQPDSSVSGASQRSLVSCGPDL